MSIGFLICSTIYVECCFCQRQEGNDGAAKGRFELVVDLFVLYVHEDLQTPVLPPNEVHVARQGANDFVQAQDIA